MKTPIKTHRKNTVTGSEFYMWRTVFALVHADDVVSSEEVRYMAEVMEDVPFNDEQRALLNDDIHNPKDAQKMFAKITDTHDQTQFFKYAREVVWVDGTYDKTEENALIALIRVHLENVDLEALMGHTGLTLENPVLEVHDAPEVNDKVVAVPKDGILKRFKSLFLK